VGVTYSFDELQVLQRSTRRNLAPGRATLLAAWREGISGGLPEMAVDITLLDNADALPACPQQQQIAA
jgi:hypothetical protein